MGMEGCSQNITRRLAINKTHPLPLERKVRRMRSAKAARIRTVRIVIGEMQPSEDEK
jgi:hypothetical protein